MDSTIAQSRRSQHVRFRFPLLPAINAKVSAPACNCHYASAYVNPSVWFSHLAASTIHTTHSACPCITQNWLHTSSSNMSVPLETVRHQAEQCTGTDAHQGCCVFTSVTVGLSATRTVNVIASRRDAFSDIASTMRSVLEPAQQRADIQFVDATSTCLRMSALLSEHLEASSSSEPIVLTAVLQPRWQFKLLTNAPHHRVCDCLGHTCCWDVWGYSITINANSDPAVYNRGTITRLRRFTKRMKSKQWDRFYHCHPRGYNIRKLCEKTALEYLWACKNCDKIAIVALDSCTPTDPHNWWPWQVSLPALGSGDVPKEEVWCGQCFEKWHATERLATMTSSLTDAMNDTHT